jgi:transketolase
MGTLQLGPRRATYLDVSELPHDTAPLAPDELAVLEDFDLLYRALCAILYNYVPLSGHPGGSISSGRIAIPLVFGALDYDLSDPDRRDADILSYAAGHKALGLYALWALRNEVARIGAPSRSTATRRRRPRSSGSRPARRASASRARSASPSARRICSGRPRRACT